MLLCGAVQCCVLQSVAVCCDVLKCASVCFSVLQCCSLLQCVVECFFAFQYVSSGVFRRLQSVLHYATLCCTVLCYDKLWVGVSVGMCVFVRVRVWVCGT